MHKLKRIKSLFSQYKENSEQSLVNAIFNNDIGFVKDYLNNNYYEINKLDSQYRTYLDYACISGNFKIIQLLVSRQAKLGVLFYLIQNEEDFIAKLEDLYDAGYDISAIDKLGFAPMHYATTMGFSKAISKLMSLDAKISNMDLTSDVVNVTSGKHPRVGVYVGTA